MLTKSLCIIRGGAYSLVQYFIITYFLLFLVPSIFLLVVIIAIQFFILSHPVRSRQKNCLVLPDFSLAFRYASFFRVRSVAASPPLLVKGLTFSPVFGGSEMYSLVAPTCRSSNWACRTCRYRGLHPPLLPLFPVGPHFQPLSLQYLVQPDLPALSPISSSFFFVFALAPPPCPWGD